MRGYNEVLICLSIVLQAFLIEEGKSVNFRFHSYHKKTYRRILISSKLVGFVALRPKSTAMVIVGRTVHLTTLFPGQA